MRPILPELRAQNRRPGQTGTGRATKIDANRAIP